MEVDEDPPQISPMTSSKPKGSEKAYIFIWDQIAELSTTPLRVSRGAVRGDSGWVFVEVVGVVDSEEG